MKYTEHKGVKLHISQEKMNMKIIRVYRNCEMLSFEDG